MYLFNVEKNTNKGFTLLLSLIIMSIVLTVAFSVFEVFFLTVIMSGTVKDSQSAFYAADTGIECVYYNDVKLGPLPNPGAANIQCNNQTEPINLPDDSFELLFGGSGESCVSVVLDFNDTPPLTKRIDSYGRSRRSAAGCGASFPRRTERGIYLEYD